MGRDPRSYFASVTNLGNLQSLHAWDRRGVILAAAVVFAWTFAACFTQEDGPSLNVAALQTSALVAVPMALWVVWRWSLAAAVYEHGFAHHSWRGLVVARWDEVGEVWQKIVVKVRPGQTAETGTVHSRYTIRLASGRAVVVSDALTNAAQFGAALQHGVSTALWPRYVQSLQAGERVKFGSLAVDGERIYAGGKAMPWSDVEAVRVENGVVVVKEAGSWFRGDKVKVSDVPNVFIFWDLVKHFGRRVERD